LQDHEINVKRREQGLPYTNLLLLRGCGQRLGNYLYIHSLKIRCSYFWAST